MFYRDEHWPGGNNLATTPAIWRRMFEEIPSDHFGLNYDPSHFIWQQMDPIRPAREFAEKLFHLHAKDAAIDREQLNEVGIYANPVEFHHPKLPGLGDLNWGEFFGALGQAGSHGSVCVEIEDKAFEGELEIRYGALRQSARFLRQFC